jgi:hypothetical protein
VAGALVDVARHVADAASLVIHPGVISMSPKQGEVHAFGPKIA